MVVKKEILMGFQDDKKSQIAYLGALTLLFSYGEMILPRVVPFLRLGLANVVILGALSLEWPSFLILCFLKSLASGLFGGFLFSPFFLVSLFQSFSSALVMFGIFRLVEKIPFRFISLYGISMAGSAVSGLVQIFLSSLYLGRGTYAFLGPVLLFSIFSGILTAFICQSFSLSQRVKNLNGGVMVSSCAGDVKAAGDGTGHDLCGSPRNFPKPGGRLFLIFRIGLIVAGSALAFMSSKLPVVGAVFVISLVMQLLSGRRFLLLPHLSMWIFVILSTAFFGQGRILFTVGNFSLTQGGLISGVRKCLALSSAMCFSQCLAGVRISEKWLAGRSLAMFRLMVDKMRSKELAGLGIREKISCILDSGARL